MIFVADWASKNSQFRQSFVDFYKLAAAEVPT